MGKRQVAIAKIGHFFALTVEEASGRRAAHGVAVAEDVEARGQLADVRMHPFHLGEDAFDPDLARRFEQQAAPFSRCHVVQGTVIGEHRATQVTANQLMGGADVTEAGAVVEEGWPGIVRNPRKSRLASCS